MTVQNLTLEDVKIIFRNFSGAEGKFNAAGNRNFSLLIPNEEAPRLEELGWKVKYLKPREEGEEPQAFLPVVIKFSKNPKARPPKVVMITGNNKTTLPEEMVDVIDYVDIEKVDVIIRAYEGDYMGQPFVKPYLVAAYITIRQDELEIKYEDYNEVGYMEQQAIESAGSHNDFEDLGEKREQLAIDAGF